jgi:hypothetical protein
VVGACGCDAQISAERLIMAAPRTPVDTYYRRKKWAGQLQSSDGTLSDILLRPPASAAAAAAAAARVPRTPPILWLSLTD